MPAYTITIARELAAQLRRFVTLNPHQLAGHVANLDFWSGEVAHCLSVIDGYRARFERLAKGQGDHTARHRTIEFSHRDPCCTKEPAARPKQVPDGEREEARRELCDAFYHFLVRCEHVGMIEADDVRRLCGEHDISVDAADLTH